MARSKVTPIIRLVPQRYRADYCRITGIGYGMIESHARMARSYMAKPVYPYGRVDLEQRITDPKVPAWQRLLLRARHKPARVAKPAS